ncbi:transporter [Spirochaetia bacterium]|nr:transporter [Spirochaetia bacterium]
MKVWVKLFIGSVLGFILGMLLPEANPTVNKIIEFLQKLALGAGRYTAAPILVFSLTIGIYELRQDGRFWRLVFRTILILAAVSAAMIVLGITAALVFSPERIPILLDQSAEEIVFNPAQNILNIFPSNMFAVFSGDGIYLFPLCVLAFFIALGLSYDKNYTKPVLLFIDSLSRIFFHITTFFSEIFGLLIIIMAAYWAVQYKSIVNVSVFKSIIKLLLIFSFIVGFLILPLLLFLLKKKQKPWKTLYAVLGPAISAFFSGDLVFNIPVLFMHIKENLGINRRSGSVTVALWSTFGRGGSAMVAVVSFIVILKSYSSLGIAFNDIITIGLHTLLLSFLLAGNSSNAVYIALAALCSGYGHGFETGYLILKPIAFYLISIGTFLDVIIIALGSYTVAVLSGFYEERSMKRFI